MTTRVLFKLLAFLCITAIMIPSELTTNETALKWIVTTAQVVWRLYL